MKEILFSFYRTMLIDISLLNNHISSNSIGSKIASFLQLNSESIWKRNLLAPLFFVLIRLMGGAILKFGLKKKCHYIVRTGCHYCDVADGGLDDRDRNVRLFLGRVELDLCIDVRSLDKRDRPSGRCRIVERARHQ